MNRIGAAWDSYQRQVVPTNAGTVQRMECRRAFYAGAEAVFGAILQLDPGEEATAADLKMMGEVEAELTAFADAVRRGEA